MDQQLRIGDSYPPRGSEDDVSVENQTTPRGEDGSVFDYELHSEANSEQAEAATLEQRRAFKIEFQVWQIFQGCEVSGSGDCTYSQFPKWVNTTW